MTGFREGEAFQLMELEGADDGIQVGSATAPDGTQRIALRLGSVVCMLDATVAQEFAETIVKEVHWLRSHEGRPVHD